MVKHRPQGTQLICPYGFATCSGCQGVEVEDEPLREGSVYGPHRSDRVLHSRAHHDEQVFWTAMCDACMLKRDNNPKPVEFKSPDVIRQLFFSRFTDGLGWLHDQSTREHLVEQLHDWFSLQSNAMTATKDTFLLVQMFRRTHDERYRSQAVLRRHAALVHLRRDLQKAELIREDATLAAINMMVACDAYSELEVHNRNWRRHNEGSCAVLRARGPGSVHWDRDVTRNVIYLVFCVGAAQAVFDRKPFLFSEPTWLSNLQRVCRGRLWCIFHLACETPVILQRMDQLSSLADESSEAKIADLLTELVYLQDCFHHWLLDWYTSIPSNPIRIKHVSEFPVFVARYGLAVTSAYTTVFDFPSDNIAKGHRLYWLFLFSICEAIYTLWKRLATEDEVPGSHLEHAALAVDECADSICRMAPYDIEAKTPETSLRSLMWAASWHRRRGNMEKSSFASIVATQTNEPSRHGDLDPIAFYIKGRTAGNEFLVRRLLDGDRIGPPRCCLKTMRRRARS